MNLMMLLEMAATAMASRVAVGPLDGGVTCDGLMDSAAGLAGRLRASRAKHLVLCDEPGAVLPVALFGAAWGGVPYVPINYRLADDDLCRLAERVAPGALADGGDPPRHLVAEDAGKAIRRGARVALPEVHVAGADRGGGVADQQRARLQLARDRHLRDLQRLPVAA